MRLATKANQVIAGRSGSVWNRPRLLLSYQRRWNTSGDNNNKSDGSSPASSSSSSSSETEVDLSALRSQSLESATPSLSSEVDPNHDYEDRHKQHLSTGGSKAEVEEQLAFSQTLKQAYSGADEYQKQLEAKKEAERLKREERRFPGGGKMQVKNFQSSTADLQDPQRFVGTGLALDEVTQLNMLNEEQTRQMSEQISQKIEDSPKQWDPTYKMGMKRSNFRWLIIGCASFIGLSLFLYLRPPAATEAEKKRNMHFFARLNADPSVTVTYSGLMFREISKESESKEPYFLVNPDHHRHAVKIHYEGRLVDGTVFDSSYDSEPCVFPADSLIPGLAQAVTHMTRGSEFEFFIPPHLAYGEWGSSFIPSHEPLVFKVKLVDFWKDAGTIKEHHSAIRF